MKKLFIILVLASSLFASRPFFTNEFPVVKRGKTLINCQLNLSGDDDHCVWIGHGLRKADLEVLLFPKLNLWKAIFLIQPVFEKGVFLHFGTEFSKYDLAYQATLGYLSKNAVVTVNPSFFHDFSIMNLKALIEARLKSINIGCEAIAPRSVLIDHRGKVNFRIGLILNFGRVQPHLSWNATKNKFRAGALFEL